MHRPDTTPAGPDLIIPVQGVSPGRSCGPLRLNSPSLPSNDAAGAILLAHRFRPADIDRILASAGTLTLVGTLLSHVNLLAREFGKPGVALLPQTRGRLAAPDEGGVLELGDAPGAPRGRLLLEEGEILVLDGERGLLRVPGGCDRAARCEIRRVHSLLASYAAAPDAVGRLDALTLAAAELELPVLQQLVEVVLLCRVVPAGLPTQRFVQALLASNQRGRVESILARVEIWVTGQVEERGRRTLVELEEIESPDELNRRLAALRFLLSRDRNVLDDIGAKSASVAAALEEVERRIESRRAVLREGITEKLRVALKLPEERLGEEFSALVRLARHAPEADVDARLLERLELRLAARVEREREWARECLVIPLDSHGVAPRGQVGGKAAGLLRHGTGLPGGCRVPLGFVVTASAYERHLLGGASRKIGREIERGADGSDISRLARAAILGSPVPREIAAAVEEAHQPLRDRRLAIRSSASAEDAPEGSLAGQFDTYLGVHGLEELLDSLRWSWASLWNVHALRLLGESGGSALDARMAVLVHELVPSRSAGVMFTRDPSGGPDTVLVNATWGLGEAISQGLVCGDLFRVRRSTGETTNVEPGNPQRQIILDPERWGTLTVDLPAELVGKPCLDGEQLARLAELARQLERIDPRALNVEFGFDPEGELVLFQVRRALAEPLL
jgi:pyruvate,water dikinase